MKNSDCKPGMFACYNNNADIYRTCFILTHPIKDEVACSKVRKGARGRINLYRCLVIDFYENKPHIPAKLVWAHVNRLIPKQSQVRNYPDNYHQLVQESQTKLAANQIELTPTS